MKFLIYCMNAPKYSLLRSIFKLTADEDGDGDF